MDQRRVRWAKQAKAGLVVVAGAWTLGAMQAQQTLMGRPVAWASWAALGALGALGAWLRPGPEAPDDRDGPRRPAVRATVLWLTAAAVTLGGMLALLDRTWFSPPPYTTTMPESWLSLGGAGLMFTFLVRQVLGWLLLLVRRVPQAVASWLAWGALLASAALTVAAAQDWRHHPHRYQDTLQPLGVLSPAGALDTAGLGEVPIPDTSERLSRTCEGGWCTYHGNDPSFAPRLPDEPVEVRFDAAHYLLVLHTAHQDAIWSTARVQLSQPSSGQRLRDVRAGLSMPLFWIASAVVGQLAAVAMLLRARRWGRLLGALRQAREGTAVQGWVQLEGQGDLRLPESLRELPEGSPVTVLWGEQREGYRADLTGSDVLAGTVAHHRQRVRRRWVDHLLLVAAFVLLTSTPLVVGWALGLHGVR